ncbi:MAG TPA: hypothetical protein VHF01_10680 [Candidatus Acidoferrum sp.]|nr:hypothetical protein [Candidatus Acidoferrum sp.]
MPNIELKDIDEQIQRLQELRKIVADPGMASLLNQLMASKNGQSSLLHGDKQSERKAKKKGTFINKIEESCKLFGSARFTIRDVIDKFESAGNTFNAKDKSVAVYSAMKRLESRGVLKLVEKGIGAKPSFYEYIHRFPREREAGVK